MAVLWILVALSTLAMIFSVYLSNSARALGATDIGVQSEALVSASLELAAYQLLSADEKARPAQGSFRFRMDDAAVLATFTSEAARVDLNKASKEMLANLFEVLGAEGKVGGGSRQSHRRVADPTQARCSQRRRSALSRFGSRLFAETGAVCPCQRTESGAGCFARLVERVLPYVTVFSKSADVDVLLAPPEVIAALPGMTPEVLNDFLKQRPSLPRDQKAVAAALGPAVKAAGSLPETKAFRVLTTIRFDNGRGTSTEAVILLASAEGKDKGKDGAKDNIEAKDKSNDGGKDNTKDNKDSAKDKEPYRILSWQDQVESLTRPSRQAGG